jgi:glycerophosphoryl diester phosphodiesterase
MNSQKISIISLLILINATTYGSEPLIVAHRGASQNAPENTIPAFNLAWKQGADAIEGDFHLTKDGHIVCIHDINTNKVSDKNLVIKDSLLADLQKLDVGRHKGKKFTGTNIPTISEVFTTIPIRKKIYIEIKSDESIVPALVEEIEESGLEIEQVTIISFNEEAIHAFKSAAPQYQAFWLSSFKKDESGSISPSTDTILQTLSRIKADGFSSNKNLINKAIIDTIIEKGYEYHVWTVDKPRIAKRFKSWGAKSITTNIPGIIKRKLTAANKRP